MNTQPLKNTESKVNIWKDTDPAERNMKLNYAIIAARKRMGQHSGDADVYNMAKLDTIEIINENYSWFSVDEIEDVLYLGASGLIGDNISISTRTIATWFRNYLFEYRPKISRFIKDTTPTLPESTKVPEIDGKAYLNEMYELYHDTGITYSKTYDILHKAELIKNTKPEIERYLTLARLEVQQEAEKRVGNGSITVWEYAQAIQEGPSKDEKIDAACKRIAVAQHFDKMKLREKPKDVIKAKQGTLKGYTGTIKLKTN